MLKNGGKNQKNDISTFDQKTEENVYIFALSILKSLPITYGIVNNICKAHHPHYEHPVVVFKRSLCSFVLPCWHTHVLDIAARLHDGSPSDVVLTELMRYTSAENVRRAHMMSLEHIVLGFKVLIVSRKIDHAIKEQVFSLPGFREALLHDINVLRPTIGLTFAEETVCSKLRTD